MLTQERLKELLEYNPLTGEFSYRQRGYNNSTKPGQRAGVSDGQGYLRIKLDGLRYRSHRLAWLYVHGEWPAQDIDHINGVRSDNRIANLRDVPRQANLQNAHNRKPGRAGLAGVTPRNGKFVAQILIGGKCRYLGRFSTAEMAHEAYLVAKRKYHDGYVQ
jgi:AP2 domain.